MPLKFHRDGFALLDQQPRVDADARTRMKAQETKYGFTFPAAVAEWLGNGGKGWLGRLFVRHRDGLKELAWNKFGAPLKVYDQERRYDPVADGMLVLIASREWGYWAVRLEGDDPPVFWGDDIPGPGAEGHQWVPVTERFSDFIHAAAWRFWKADRARGGSGPLASICMPALCARNLAFLRAHFEEGPSHAADGIAIRGKPRDWHYLFRREGCYLWVWDQPSEKKDEDSAWFLGGDTPASLRETLRLLWHPGAFYIEEHVPNTQGPAEGIWETMLADPPPFPGSGWERLFGVDLVPLFASGELLTSDRAPVLPPPLLDYLIDQLEETSRQTFAGGVTAHAFQGDGCRLFLVSGERDSSWWLHGDTPEALAILLRQVGHISELADRLEARTEVGRQILAAQRGGKGKAKLRSKK
jgi:hypothetical protein